MYVTSDRMQECRGTLTWTVTTAAGDTIHEGHKDVDIPARKSWKAETLSSRKTLNGTPPKTCWFG